MNSPSDVSNRRRVHLFDADQVCSFCGQPWSKHDPTLPDDPDGPMLLCPEPPAANVKRGFTSADTAANRQESADSGTRPERVPYDQPQTWYFTFGFAHAHKNSYYVIESMGGDEARERMHEVFGRQWAFQYDEHDWFKSGISQAEKYGLTEVT